MIKIKIFCSFAPSDKCKETFERINFASSIDFYGKDKRYHFTNDDDFTHAIIINTAMPVLTIPKENVIGLAFEPIYFLCLTPEFVEYSKEKYRNIIKGAYERPEKYVSKKNKTRKIKKNYL